MTEDEIDKVKQLTDSINRDTQTLKETWASIMDAAKKIFDMADRNSDGA